MDCNSLFEIVFVLLSLIVSEVRMGPQGLGMVCLGVALRSTCTYCTLSALILNIHGVRGTKLELHGLNLETWKL